jgi:hypothetical protein
VVNLPEGDGGNARGWWLGCSTLFQGGERECGVSYVDCGVDPQAHQISLSSTSPLDATQAFLYNSVVFKMTTAIATKNSSASPSNPPLIFVDISTQIPTFDLSINTPFAITVVLTLHHHRPITFRKRDTLFFKYPLGSPGLEFTNIRTSETQIGMGINECYIGSSDGDLPEEANRKDWITLLLDKSYTMDASIEQIGGGESRMRTLMERASGSDEKPTSLKWPMVHRLLDGETFEIKINDGARVNRWIEGTLEEILEWSAEGRTLILVEQAIDFEVKETAQFKVKRPDPDGSLNWL